MLELPQTGSAFPYPLVSTIRLYSYVGGRALFRLLLELAFVGFTVYYMVVQIKKCRKEGIRSYLKCFWSGIEVIGIVTSIVACGFYGAKFIAVKLTMNDFHKDKSEYHPQSPLISKDIEITSEEFLSLL